MPFFWLYSKSYIEVNSGQIVSTSFLPLYMAERKSAQKGQSVFDWLYPFML